MGKSSSPPPAPDPVATANAQSKYDKETAGYNAALNRYDVSTPYGSLNWTNTGTDPATGAPIYSQQVNLTPASQATLDQTQDNAHRLSQVQGQLLGSVGNIIGGPMDTNGMPKLQGSVNFNGPGFATGVNAGNNYQTSVADRGPGYAKGVADRGPGYAGPVAQGDLAGLANKATQASYDSSMALLRPQMDIDRKAAVQDLANRGIPVGSEAYNNIMGSLDRNQGFTQTQAANNAVLTGQNYENQLFGQGATNANLQNTAQQGMFSQGLNNANLQNAAQAGMFGQGQVNANLNNSVQQNMFSQGLANAGLQNDAQTQGYNQALTSGNFSNAANAQAMQQMFALRNQPLNEYNAMMTGTQVQAPQFQGTPAVMANAPNYTGAVAQNYQGQLNSYNAQTGANNSFMSGLFGLGGAALGAPVGTFPAIGRALGL